MARGLQRTLARAAARNAGTQVSKAGLTAATTGTGGTYQTVITFKDMLLTVTDDIIAKVDHTLDGAAAAYTAAIAADVAAAATHDGTTTPIDAFLNVGFPTNTDIDNDGILKVTGKITILWEAWGDNA
jgi:hypothetical protein